MSYFLLTTSGVCLCFCYCLICGGDINKDFTFSTKMLARGSFIGSSSFIKSSESFLDKTDRTNWKSGEVFSSLDISIILMSVKFSSESYTMLYGWVALIQPRVSYSFKLFISSGSSKRRIYLDASINKNKIIPLTIAFRNMLYRIAFRPLLFDFSEDLGLTELDLREDRFYVDVSIQMYSLPR